MSNPLRSPEQIAKRLRRAYPDGMQKQFFAETIYVGLHGLPHVIRWRALVAGLWQGRKARLLQARGAGLRSQIFHMMPIADCAAEVAGLILSKGSRHGSAV